MDTSTALEASSSSSPSSSSTTTTSSSSPYDVFLSFSGEDTRKTFTDHLYWAMKDAGIDFFMEENESIRRGENISDKVKQIIEGSRVSVIVFSSRYADSIWCLEELVQIMECRRTLKQMVLPIFYDLSPSDGIGTFVQAFQKHRERFHEDTDIQEKIWRWTDALTEAAGLTVWVFETTNGYEGMFIREIIDEITRQLKSPTPVGIAFSELQRLRSPKLEDIDSTEHTDTASSGSSAKSSLSMLPLKKRCHEPDHSDSTSSKFPKRSTTPSWTYDVFLSFRGEDTRYNFTDQLYRALDRHGINTFIDLELRSGEEISPSLLEAIEKSRISVIIFSENYASSRWCLDELVHILECRKSKGQMTRPIFYKVDPSDVRHQRNSYGAAFVNHSCRYDLEKVQRWRLALTEAADLKGATLNKEEYETAFINGVVEEISTQVLNQTYLHVPKYLVGIESCLKEVEELLGVGGHDGRVVGIWGTSGIGKTTIAKAVYNAIYHKFEGSCFLEDVKETSTSRAGVLQLQNTLLSEISRGSKWNVANTHRGISLIEKLVRGKKILLILDDVDQREQLDNLIEVDWFSEGCRVIITTKDRGLLESYGVGLIYEVQKLKEDKALELFSLNAFRRIEPPDNYFELAKRAIGHAQGLPLALNIIGFHLHKKNMNRWQAVLNGYNSYDGEPYRKIQGILRKSYDDWSFGLQQVFLHIACFFKGEDKDYVLHILRNSKLPEDSIEVLVEKAIITIEYNRILMHDLLEQMGKHIVWEESPDEPGKRSRLWHHEDVCNVLIDCRGTKKIRGIVVNLPKPDVIPLNPQSFLKMVNLEFFINRNAYFSGRVDYLPNSLRLIEFGGRFNIDQKHTYVLNLSSDFYPRHLVKVDVSYSGIRQLKEFKNLGKLTWMNLSGCEFLEKIPNLSGSPNIKHLNLSKCKNLVEVDDSVGFLDELVKLDLSWCSNLTRFATRLGLRSLEELDLNGCKRLERFPKIEKDKMKSLTSLKIGKSGIKELPSSIAYLTGLESLYANGCELQKIPDLSGCPNIERMELRYCKSLVEVDDSVGFLDKLKWMNLTGCSKLTRFATRLGSRSLSSLDLGGCRRLESFPEIEGKMESLWHLNIEESGIRELPSIAYFPELGELNASDCDLQNIQLPPFGKEVKFDEVSSCSTKLQLCLEGCNLSDSDFLVPLDCWSALTALNLSRNNFVCLPDCISKVVNLKTLFLIGCKRLREIPVLPSKLKWLYLNDCTSLEKIPELPPRLKNLSLRNCPGLSGDEVAKLENKWLNEVGLSSS